MMEKSIYTKMLGEKVAQRARSNDGSYHIIPSYLNKWSVVPDGSAKSIKSFGTQKEAIVFAKRITKSKAIGEVIIHGITGQVLARK